MNNVNANFGASNNSGRGADPDSRDHTDTRQSPNWRWWGSGALLTTAIIVGSLFSPYFRHQWALSVGRQSTAYTALSFNNAAKLPATAVRGKAIHVSFTITNETSDPVSYRYVIAAGSGSLLTSVDAATRTVAPGASWAIERFVEPTCPQNTCRIQVSLPQEHEHIDLLLTLKGDSSK